MCSATITQPSIGQQQTGTPTLPRSVEVDVPHLAAQTLDQAQLGRSCDHFGVDDAGALGDQKLDVGQQGENLLAAGPAAHDELQFRRRAFHRPLLMLQPALREKQGLVFGHNE